MKFSLVLAVVLVACVTSSQCKPVKTGVIGAVGFDLIGNLSEGIWQEGFDLTQSGDPLSNILGNALQIGGELGLAVGDDVVGGFAGDTVNYLAQGVDDIGAALETVGPVGNLLASILRPGAKIVEALGGDQL